jgi:hypothetical protein
MALQHLPPSGGLQEVKSDVRLELWTPLVLKCEQSGTRTIRIGAHSPVLSPSASQEVIPAATAGAIFAQAFALTPWLKVRWQLLEDFKKSFIALESGI